MSRSRTWPFIVICTLCACGGQVELELSCSPGQPNCRAGPTGGVPALATGGSGNAVGTSVMDSGGSFDVNPPGCTVRSETYAPGTDFPLSPMNDVRDYPDCVPTCGESVDTVCALPAGPCSSEPVCTMFAFYNCWSVDSGVNYVGSNGFVCACDNGHWSCQIAQ